LNFNNTLAFKQIAVEKLDSVYKLVVNAIGANNSVTSGLLFFLRSPLSLVPYLATSSFFSLLSRSLSLLICSFLSSFLPVCVCVLLQFKLLTLT
jgi:hypothetical protein